VSSFNILMPSILSSLEVYSMAKALLDMFKSEKRGIDGTRGFSSPETLSSSESLVVPGDNYIR
jgi:hypothetical protein